MTLLSSRRAFIGEGGGGGHQGSCCHVHLIDLARYRASKPVPCGGLCFSYIVD